MNEVTHSGFVAILGRPNVGKSTLLNRLLGEKLSITSRKAQTTRHRIRGIKTSGQMQTIFIDTPGLQQQRTRALHQAMNRAAKSIIHDVDIILFLVDALHWKKDDDWILQLLKQAKVPVILAVNKVDLIKEKDRLLPLLDKLSQAMSFYEVIPISAKDDINIEVLEQAIEKLLPAGPAFFPSEQYTDRSESFIIAEYIREKLLRFLGEEVPHVVNVEVEKYTETENVIHIHALIWVEREGHKKIVIGKGGAVLKQVGVSARQDIERMLGKQVNLKLWVKVKGAWADDARIIKRLGIDE